MNSFWGIRCFWHCPCFPHLLDDKGEGEPATAEAEDGLSLPKLSQVQGVGLLVHNTFRGVTDDDREEDRVQEKDEGGHCKAEVPASLPCLPSPKSYGCEFSKNWQEDVASCQVLQALQAGQLQRDENNDRQTKGKGQPWEDEIPVSYESQADDSEESRQDVNRSKPEEQS